MNRRNATLVRVQWTVDQGFTLNEISVWFKASVALPPTFPSSSALENM